MNMFHSSQDTCTCIISQCSSPCEAGAVLSPSDSVQTRKPRPGAKAPSIPPLFLRRQSCSWGQFAAVVTDGHRTLCAPPCPVSPLFSLCSWLLSFQLNGNIGWSFEGVYGILGILHDMPYFPHTKTLQGSYLPFLSTCTETDNVLQIFHLFPQICSPPFSTLLWATVTPVHPHGPHQGAPMPTGAWLGPAQENTGRRCEREEREIRTFSWLLPADVSAPVARPSPYSSFCLQVPVSTSSLPLQAKKGGHSQALQSHAGAWGNRKTECPLSYML